MKSSKIPSRYLAAALMVLLGLLSGAQEATNQETIVRTAYAKLSYADEVRIVLDALQQAGRDKLWITKANFADRALDTRLNFELSNFHAGKISAIADRKISEFDGALSAIGGEVLDVTPSVYNYSVDGTPSKYVAYVKFAWRPSPYQSLSPAENWSVARALQSEQFEGKRYTDYVTYTVTVTLGNRSRTYNAWALFGRDEKGKQQVYFMDAVADSTAVLFAFEHSMYPTAFAETDLRTVPFVDKWLYDNAQSCRASHSEKDNNKVDVCCNMESGQCGVALSSLRPRNSGRMVPGQPRARLLLANFYVSSPPLHPLVQAAAPTGCAKFNANTTFPHGLGDSQEHNDGQHNFTATVVGSCTYTDGATSPGPCNVQCSAQSSSNIQEFGSLSGLVFVHATAKTDASGGDFTNGGTAPISCLGVSGGTVRSCTFPCSTTVSITAGGKGNLGATISFPPSALWNDQNQGQVSCQPRSTAPTPTPTPPSPPPPPSPCGPPPADEIMAQTNENPDCEPLIIDLTGDGFQLTNTANGVIFDIRADGRPLRIPWTAGSSAAFLVLDRNGNGLVDDGSELFGNATPQPVGKVRPNGFLALAQYDQNADGVIDVKDPIYARLRLWVDSNHDGVSQPGELHTLSEMGVFAISLDYSLSKRTDEFGNVFRYRAKLNQGQHRDSDVGKKIYDVFFVNK
jgi:hypothetical protein